jgi:hypothetical protein
LQFRAHLHHFWENHSVADETKPEWPPLEKMALSPIEEEVKASAPLKEEKAVQVKTSHTHLRRPNKQLVLAETTDKENKTNKLVIVEVEFFPPDPHMADLRRGGPKTRVSNYTKEGEDPNLRITHYPPTNRIH